MIKKIFIFISLSLTSYELKPNFIAKIYATILGSEDLKEEYKKEIIAELNNTGVKNPESISIKKASAAGSTIAGVEVSSFTAAPFGIWFDEDNLDSLDQKSRTWSISHECSHYALKHHQKLIASVAILGSSIILTLYGLYKKALPDISTQKKVGLITASGFIGLVLFIKALQSMVKNQEKEADIYAAKTLINSDRKNIVLNQIKNLKKIYNEDSNYWWPSIEEQIKYLEKEI